MAAVQANMSDYEAERQHFRWEAPEHFNFAVDVVGKWAADPKKEAMWWVGPTGEERHITFAEFHRKSNQAADAFGKLGIRQGDRVLVMLPRVVEWWEIMLGLMKLGAVPIPCTVLLTPKDIQYRAETSEATTIITDSDNAPKYDEVRDKCPSIKGAIIVGNFRPRWTSYAEVAAEGSPSFKPTPTKNSDPCLIYFTSGTVGYPKMVLHTQASYGIGHSITGKYWLDLRPDDLHWNVSETGWAKAAWSNFFGPWSQGAAMFIQDARGKFNPKETLAFLASYPITTFCAPPTVYRLLVLEDLKSFTPKALRHCVGAGEPLNPEVIETWQEATGMTIRDGYGQTETVLICGNFPPIKVKPGSMGKPSPGYYLSVIDDEGNELPPNKEGDIAIKIKPERPLGLFQEYWKNPDAMARSFKGDWYITGDRAYKDEEGYFWFVGRADDVIISAGYRIGPFEVESALVEHPAVAEAAVVASPDEVRGEVVKAYVILAPGYTASEKLAEELQEHVKAVTAPYKYPREIEFVAELPKTISGKIRRVELRERERARKQGKE